MIRTNFLRAGIVAAALLLAAAGTATAADTVRPEVGKPLQAAESLYKSRHYKEALAKVAEADAASGKTPYENYVIQRTRGSIAAAAGDYDTAAKAFEAVVASGRAAGAEQLKLIQAIAGLHYQSKDYGKSAQWAQRYFKEGGNDPAVRTMLVQAYFLTNDCNAVAKIVDVDNGRRPTEQELQILANCYNKQKDSTGYVGAIEKLVTYYPKKEYWTDLLNRVQKKDGFSDRLSLDVYRLKLATGNLTTANDYLEMAQLAIQADFPAEAKRIVDKGYDAKVLGVGKEADRHKRLQDLVLRTLDQSRKARDRMEKEAAAESSGNSFVTLGYNLVTDGAPQKGLAFMEQGIKKGHLKRPEDAKLLLGVAQFQSGSKSRAIATFKSVQGRDGPADLARLWLLLTQRG